MINYKTHVEPYLNGFIKVNIKQETVDKIDCLVRQIIQKKQEEKHHQIDNGQEYKRFMTGLLGEAALSNVIKKPIIDWSIGNSINYNIADLSKLGLNVGIKTVEYGKFPIVFKNSYYPEIILLKKTFKEFFVCGLATVETLKKYQDDNLILSPLLRNRGIKTGFYGFNELLRFSNLQELKELVR